jgi:hypothetical protein
MRANRVLELAGTSPDFKIGLKKSVRKSVVRFL